MIEYFGRKTRREYVDFNFTFISALILIIKYDELVEIFKVRVDWFWILKIERPNNADLHIFTIPKYFEIDVKWSRLKKYNQSYIEYFGRKTRREIKLSGRLSVRYLISACVAFPIKIIVISTPAIHVHPHPHIPHYPELIERGKQRKRPQAKRRGGGGGNRGMSKGTLR